MIHFRKFPRWLLVCRMQINWLADAISCRKRSDRLFISTNAHALPDTIGYNVIGEWKGSEFPDQYITVGGHLDSWDPAEGAQDDGAGCVQSIEVLRALKAIGYKPKHTIRVVLFTDEENGGRGAKAYSSEAKTKNEKHIFALESDGGGFTPRGFSFKGTESQMASHSSHGCLCLHLMELLNLMMAVQEQMLNR